MEVENQLDAGCRVGKKYDALYDNVSPDFTRFYIRKRRTLMENGYMADARVGKWFEWQLCFLFYKKTRPFY